MPGHRDFGLFASLLADVPGSSRPKCLAGTPSNRSADGPSTRRHRTKNVLGGAACRSLTRWISGEKLLPPAETSSSATRQRRPSALWRGTFTARGLQPTGLGPCSWGIEYSPYPPLRRTKASNWQLYFGNGLVRTAEDFGLQGELPTHPALLDWMAREFIDSGWDVKALQKKIVMSATHRQRSKLSPDVQEKDPENRFLARAPRYRLSAESVRNNALLAAGLLNRRIGGPSVFPYQPRGLWKEMAYSNMFTAQVYRQSAGEDLVRRSMYTFWKRTVPPPSLGVFDAPDREQCIARRSRTNTPLQALVLMNDPTYVEAAPPGHWPHACSAIGGRKMQNAFASPMSTSWPAPQVPRRLSSWKPWRGSRRRSSVTPRNRPPHCSGSGSPRGTRPSLLPNSRAGRSSRAASSTSTRPSARNETLMHPRLEHNLIVTQ